MIKRLSLSLNKLITFTQTTLFSLSIKNDFQDWILGPFFFLRKSLEKKTRIFQEFNSAKEIKLVKHKHSTPGGLKHQVNIIIRPETSFDREALLLNCFYTTGTIYKQIDDCRIFGNIGQYPPPPNAWPSTYIVL